MNAAALQLSVLLETADAHLETYVARTKDVVHDLKGIRPSEGFFIYALFASDPPRRILESGRARGYSTQILARCFPEAAVISIEFDEDSPDVAIAAQRLGAEKNVECRFGDARAELPRLLAADDIILIDGPKDFRALKLALRLLRTGKPRAVFLHDLTDGIPVRRFLERHVASAFFSDAPQFLRRYSFLDNGGPRPSPGEPPARIAPTPHEAAMGCIPGEARNYSCLLSALTLLQWKERIRDTAAKFLGRRRKI